MLRNYLTIALRNLIKHRTYSVLNIIGLAIGLAACLLIASYLLYELSYDRFNRNYATLYRIVQHQHQDGAWYEVARSPAKMATTLKASFQEVKKATRFALWGNVRLSFRDKSIDEPNGIYAESALLEMFSFSFLQGTPQHALGEPNSIVLTETTAHRYFGATNPIGRRMTINGQYPLQVTAVIRDLPDNSHLQFDFILPFALLKNYGANLDEWGANAFYTYVQLHHPSQQASLDAKLRSFAQAIFGNPDEHFYLQPIGRIHLHSQFDFNTDFGRRGDIRHVWLFSGLAALVLLLACFNFTNLSTARSLGRAREVGVRKAMGAQRNQLIGQFMAESALLVTIAGLLAILLAQTALPWVNRFLAKPLSLQLSNVPLWACFGSVILLTVFLAGSYPALVLASYEPVKVLRGKLATRTAGVSLRQLLVTAQFTLSITLGMATLVIYQQLRYLGTKKLGLDKENLVYLPLQGAMGKHYGVIKNQLLSERGVREVSATEGLPFHSINSSGTGGIEVNGRRLSESFMITDFQTEFGFVETLGLTLTQGRSFSSAFPIDTTNFILNEEAVKHFGLTKPVGARLKFYDQQGTVVGVVKDFHFAKLSHRIQPALLRVRTVPMAYLLVRVQSADMPATLDAITRITKQFSEGTPAEAHFLEQDYDQLYHSEQTVEVLFGWFTGLAILVSCLGLLGLTAFTAEQRTKEIGIRKVLGATVSNIVGLLSKDFLKLVLIANVIAWPLAWWGMHEWLQSFAYRVTIGWPAFLIAGVSALLMALLTVSYQAMKAALANPVKSLRTE